MKTSIYLFGLFSLVQVACGQNKEKKVPMFEWSATMSCPVGYPVDVINGDLSGHGFSSLELGTHYGPWGAQGRSWGGSEKGLPKKLEAFWISYAEKQFYKIETEIDYEKILSIFQKGYIWRNANNILVKDKFYYVNVGFAPGGVVVLWVQGALETVEIGRYQGQKIALPEHFGEDFDSHDRLVYDPKYWEDIMTNEKIVPIEVQKANKTKPIPYGLWDEYRTRYNWNILISDKYNSRFYEVKYDFFNGESIYDLDDVRNELLSKEKPIPSEIELTWKNSKSFLGKIIFDESEIISAFKKMNNLNPEGDFKLKIDVVDNNYFKVAICYLSVEIPLLKSKILITQIDDDF